MAAQPGYNQSPGFLQDGGGIHLGLDVVILPAVAGAPSNGTSGTGVGVAGKGSLVVDATNGILYVNVGTKASPTWLAAGINS